MSLSDQPVIPGGPTAAELRSIVTRVVDGLADRPPEAAAVAGATPSRRTSGDTYQIAIGADHGGYPLKEKLTFRLREQGHEVLDCGTDSPEPVDYPVYAHAVAHSVASGESRWGIIIDGAGIGSAMVANKVPGVRAALCYSLATARNSREHNHANVLTLGAGLIGDNLAWLIVQEWLTVGWGGGRHARRVDLITEIEQQYLRRTEV